MINKSLLYLVERLVTMLTGLLAFVLLARFFGPETLGELSVVQSTSAVLITFVTLGLDRFIVKSLVDEKNDKVSILLSSTVMRFSGWLIYSILLLVFSWFFSANENVFGIVFIEISTVLFMHVIVFRYLLEAEGKANILAITLVISRVCGFLYLMLAISLDFSFIYTCAFLPFQSVIRTIMMLIFVRKKWFIKVSFNIDKQWMLDNFKMSFPIMISGMVFPIFMQADVLMISYFHGEHAVGLYSAPMKIILQSGYFGVAIMTAFFPVLANLYNGDNERYESMLAVVSKFMLVLSVAFSLLIYFSSDFVVAFLFGPEYEGSKVTLSILSFVVFFQISSKLYSSLLIIYGLARFEIIKAIVATILNLTLNLILIPGFYIEGAAFASLISYIISDFIIYYVFRGLRPISKVMNVSLIGLLHPIATITSFIKLKGF